MQILESTLKYNGWKYLLILCTFAFLIAFSTSYLFLSDNLYFQSLGEQLAIERIEKIIELSHKWQWLGYVFIPVVVFIRVGFAACTIYIGCFLAEIRIPFGALFKIALIADFVFVIAGITKLIILIFFREVGTLDDLQFQPLSIMELADRTTLEPYFIYPLSLVSVFELFYWLVLTRLLAGLIEAPFVKSFKLVASSYGTGLLIWVIVVMFLTINLV